MVDYTIENSGDKCKNGTSKDDNGDDSVVVVTEKPPAMEKKCDRIYHLYRVKSLNAMLIVAEAPRSAATATGAYDEFSDRPVEGECCISITYMGVKKCFFQFTKYALIFNQKIRSAL